MLKVYKNDEFTKEVLKDSFSIDKEMLIKMKTSEFPTHTSDLNNISCPTLVLCGDKKIMGVDERKGSHIMYENIPNAQLVLFKDAFDPLNTMRKDIFNEMVLDFINGYAIKQYDDVSIMEKKNSFNGPLSINKIAVRILMRIALLFGMQ